MKINATFIDFSCLLDYLIEVSTNPLFHGKTTSWSFCLKHTASTSSRKKVDYSQQPEEVNTKIQIPNKKGFIIKSTKIISYCNISGFEIDIIPI